MSRLRVAFFGDDISESVDALLHFARRGWTGRLFVGLPAADDLRTAAAECDVVGVSWSLPTEPLDAEVLLPDAVAALGPDVALYEMRAALEELRAATAAESAPRDPLPTRTGVAGPVVALSGSRSAQTRRQMHAAAAAEWFVQPLELDTSRAASQLDWVLSALRAGRSVGLTSDDTNTSHGPELEVIAHAAAAIAAGAASAGATRRIIVCGGDTSNRVTRLLGVHSLSIAANPWGDVVLLRAHSKDTAIDGLELLLDGAQVGDDDLLVRVRGGAR